MTNDMPKDIVNELRVRAAIEQINGTIFERAADEIEQLRKERDEARRKYCLAMVALEGAEAHQTAKEEGWDCFRENTNE